jgi:hypothetical protein
MLTDLMQVEIRDPERIEIERAIRGLGGGGCVNLRMRGDCIAHLLVDAGHGEGGFVVQVCLSDGSFHYLVHPSKAKREVERVVGGQLIPWPENRICTLRPTLKAIKTFAESGTLDKELVWELGG